MGNLSSTIDYRSIVNEIKFGADLSLQDVNDENYYNYMGVTASEQKKTETDGAGSYVAPDGSGSAAAAAAPSSPYRVTGETSITAARFFSKSRPIWRTLFLTDMTDEDVTAFFNYEDVRYLRMYRPHNLAVILYKCIEQMCVFISSQNYPDLDGKISNHAPSDYTAAMNATRMLAAAFPYLFEDLVHVENHSSTYKSAVTVHPLNKPGDTPGAHTHGNLNTKEGFITREYREADAKCRMKGVSPFAAEFAHHFFFKNRVCVIPGEGDSNANTTANYDGSIFANCPVFPSVVIRGAGHNQEGVPLAAVVCKALTRLCFIPYFSVGGSQRLDSAAAYFAHKVHFSDDASTTTVGDLVHGKLLWFGGGPFGSGKDSSKAGYGGAEAVARRNCVLKAIISMLCEPLMRLAPLAAPSDEATATDATNKTIGARNCMYMRFLSIFASPQHNPLSCTLAASLVSVITHYNSRGLLPYTSGFGAALPETQLALSLQLLTLSIDYYYAYDGSSNDNQHVLARREVCVGLNSSVSHGMEGYHHIKSRRNGNAFHCILHELAVSSPYARYVELAPGEIPHNPPPQHANFARQFVAGVVRILENPSYALSGTVLQGSQKTISCYTEAIHLLYRIVLHIPSLRDCFFVTTSTTPFPITSDPASTSSSTPRQQPVLAPASPLTEAGAPGTLLQSLWHFVEMGAVTYLYFSQSATVLNILLHSFESRVFREFLSQKHSTEQLEVITRSYLTQGFGVKFFAKAKSIQLSSQLPPLATISKNDTSGAGVGASFADGLSLAMCYLLSAAAPRWCYFISPLVARVLHNTLLTAANVGKIHDTVQFELRHSLAFLCEDNFLKKGATAHEATTIVASTVLDLLQMHICGTTSNNNNNSSTASPENLVILASTLATCSSFADWLDHHVGDGKSQSKSTTSGGGNTISMGEPLSGGEEDAAELAAISLPSDGMRSESAAFAAALSSARKVAVKLHALFGTDVVVGSKVGVVYGAVQRHLEGMKGKQSAASSSTSDWDLSDAELRSVFPIVMRALAESKPLFIGAASSSTATKRLTLLLPGNEDKQQDGADSNPSACSSYSASNWEALWATHALWRAIHALNRPIMFEISTSNISVAREVARRQAVQNQK